MQAEQEMAIIEVSGKMLKELEGFGFSKARAVWALHHSGNSNLEAAVNWIIDHENESNLDELPEFEVTIDIESPKQSDITEASRAKANELRDAARTKKEEEEKKREKEREKERVRKGKELMEAKRIAEDNERKRNLAFRKKEQEEEKRARDRILRKIDADEAKRRGSLGLSLEPRTVRTSTATVQPEKKFLPGESVERTERMRECLRSIRRSNVDFTSDSHADFLLVNYQHPFANDDGVRVNTAFQTLLTLLKNIANNPSEERFRKIRLSNPLIHERVGRVKGAVEFLELCGFKRIQGNEFLHLPRDSIEIPLLREAIIQLQSAITNPFFGVLSRAPES